MRSYFPFIFFLLVGFNAFAIGCEPDSIGIKIIDQNHFILHKVAAKEGWYGIARRYNIPVSNLREANKNKEESLKLNDTILVPINIAKIGEADLPKVNPAKAEAPKEKEAVVGKTDSSQKKAPAGSSVSALLSASDKAAAKFAGKEVVESGVATWISDDDINPNKYYALHRTASIGTIIKVTNRMNNKYVFVKVVGVLPDTGDNTDMVIKVSKASAEKLGVRDPKFQCALSYMATAAK